MLQVYSEHNGQYQGLDKLLNGYKKLTTNFGNINCILYNLLGFMFRTTREFLNPYDLVTIVFVVIVMKFL